MKHVVNLPKNHPFRRVMIDYFKAGTCNSVKGGVYCCNPINQGTTTTTATTAKTTTTTTATATKRVQVTRVNFDFEVAVAPFFLVPK